MSLGGGAFGNDPDWIHDAMRCALSRVQSDGLDVRIVARVSVSSALEALADSAMRLKTSQAGAIIMKVLMGRPAWWM
jgi:hypothetical protein